MKNEKAIIFVLISVLLLGILFTSYTPAAADPGDMTLISVSTGGTQGNYLNDIPAISLDGQFVSFRSLSDNLVPNDTNWSTDIYLRDTETGVTTRVSVASNGSQANGDSFNSALSGDGRFVAFDSRSSNLVAGDTNGTWDIFIHDTVTGDTKRVSVATDGSQSNNSSTMPSISADGRYVAFESGASNLVAGDTNGSDDVFVHDMETGETRRISVASNGEEANSSSFAYKAISADGRYTVFQSWANNLVAGDTNEHVDIFVHDWETGETRLASVASDGTQGNENANLPSISENGRYVAFLSYANNLVDGDTNGHGDIFVHDMQTGKTTRVSVATDGTEGDYYSDQPAISADGRFVTFQSKASNLVDEPVGYIDVYVHDLITGETRLASKTIGDHRGDENSNFPAISGDGRFIAFHAITDNLVVGDTNGGADIFLYETSWEPVWVLMYYISGDLDDQVGASYGSIMNRIEMGAGNQNVKIIVAWDQFGFGNSAYYEIQSDDDLRMLADYQEGVNKWALGELNMGSSSTLSDFLAWGMENYPADHYALIMDDHGTGLGGSMLDETSADDRLTLVETKEALATVVSSYQKLDVLVMNACLMGLIEDGYQFKDMADYYVASEDIQWIYSQGYTDTLEQIPSSSSALDVAKAYMDGYADDMVAGGRYYTMSVSDLSQAIALKAAIENLASELDFNIPVHAYTLWDIRQNQVQIFPSHGDHTEYYIDFYHFAQLVNVNFVDQAIKDAAQNLLAVINDYVVYNRSSHANAHGVSIFFPDIKSSYYTGYNNDFADGTDWTTDRVSTTSESRSTATVTWGNLLVDLFLEVDPEGVDDPNPPEPMPKATGDYLHYLPIILAAD